MQAREALINSVKKRAEAASEAWQDAAIQMFLYDNHAGLLHFVRND